MFEVDEEFRASRRVGWHGQMTKVVTHDQGTAPAMGRSAEEGDRGAVTWAAHGSWPGTLNETEKTPVTGIAAGRGGLLPW